MANPDVVDDPILKAPEGDQPSEVSVDLSKPSEQPVKETTPVPSQRPGESDAQYAARLKSLENQLAGARRINEKLQQRLEEVERRLKPADISPSTAPPMTQDELDRLVEQGQWKEAVGKIAERKVQELYEQRMALDQQQQALQRRQEVLEQSKQAVVERYPQLDPTTGDPESEVSRLYTQVLNRHPDLLSNDRGPLLAMYLMEDLKKSSLPVADIPPDAARRARAAQASLPPSRTTVKTNAVVLTKDQKEFCDQHQIKYEDYARTMQALDNQGSVNS